MNVTHVVVKADGLAAGKGVTICKTQKQVFNQLQKYLMVNFTSSKMVVLEEF